LSGSTSILRRLVIEFEAHLLRGSSKKRIDIFKKELMPYLTSTPIQGVLYDDTTNKPLVGYDVCLGNLGADSYNQGCSTTNQNGSYYLQIPNFQKEEKHIKLNVYNPSSKQVKTVTLSWDYAHRKAPANIALNSKRFVTKDEIQVVRNCGRFNSNLRPVKIAGAFGFVSSSNELMIATKYEDAYCFSNGLAPVKKNGLWGYIGTDGKLKIDYQYTSAEVFLGKQAIVYKGNQKFLINHRGNTISDSSQLNQAGHGK
jgi:hypothetical protein